MGQIKVPLYDRDNQPQYLLCIAEDLTERHLAETALKESEARLAGILDTAEDGIISIDSNRCITMFNQAAEKIFGYNASEVLERPIELLIPARCDPPHDRNINQFDCSFEVASQMGESKTVFARRKDGTEFPAEISISKLELAGSTIFTAIIRDITERMLAEKNLREHQQFLESIFESAAEVIWVSERREDGDRYDYYTLTINQAIEKISGIPADWWVGKGVYESFRDLEVANKFKSQYDNCLQRRSRVNFEQYLTFSDGKEKCFFLTIYPLQNHLSSNEDRSRILGIAIDISDRKQAEKTLLELEKQREISQMQLRFFSMASHEFRTPLSTILVIVQSLISSLDRLPEEKVIKKLHQLEKVAKRMKDIINNILKINRGETDSLTIETKLLNPEKMCVSIVKEMQINAGKNRQIIFLSQGCNKLTRVDPELFNYILTNLLSNAVKYSPQDSKIHVILKSQPEKIILIVKDRGIGIPKSEVNQLFEAFHRGKNTENTPGSGLGLTVVKKCVDLHGGTIEVDSKEGLGTTFIVTIPTAKI